LCIVSLSVRGTHPARERFTARIERSARVVVAVPRRATERPSLAMSRWTRRAKARAVSPARASVPLKTEPEASANIPRRLKCRCHQPGSDVVRIAVATPVSTIAMIARPHCVGVGAVRPSARRARRADGTTTVIRVPSTPQNPVAAAFPVVPEAGVAGPSLSRARPRPLGSG